MNNDKLLRYGLIGTVVAALGCFTPVLVLLFGAVGLSGLVGWLDYVLFPALAVCIVIAVYAFWKRRSASTPSPRNGGNGVTRCDFSFSLCLH